ncbi:hypothetical protein RN001_012982 [Aquatica leii]|uniref:Ankyrin repeat protein n=1 Tax=Aquatica leii TaxID=1421715 RepID=A0AAN7PR48_9COLE|nr:hypothetical protein RN001_012982 [Aquatica leii]
MSFLQAIFFPKQECIRFLNAVNNQNITELDYCIASGVNPNCVSAEDGNTALHIAAENNNLRIAVKLLAIPNINIEIKNRFGYPPLHIALQFNTYRMLKMLLKNNANVNSTDRCDNTALHVAARSHSIWLAQILMKHGADINARNMMMHTPLHVAILEAPFLPMVKFLVGHGADINIQTRNTSLLLEAILYCHSNEEYQIILYLLQKGVDVNCVEKITKRNALHYCAITDSNQLAVQLLKFGANVDQKDVIGKTPMDVARDRKNYELEFIFEHADKISALMNNI